MRLDYTLYTLAVVFFIITAVSAVLLNGLNQLLWTIPSAAMGILSLGVGFSRKPKTQTPQAQPTQTQTIQLPQAAEEEPVTQPLIETSTPEIPAQAEPIPNEPPATLTAKTAPAPPTIEATPNLAEQELTKVNGIGQKRAAQLNAIGIKTIPDLAQASAEEIAQKLKVSPKITAKWIQNAQQLHKK